MRRCKLAPLASTSPETLDRVLLAARMLTVQPALEESPGRPLWPSPVMRRRASPSQSAAGRLTPPPLAPNHSGRPISIQGSIIDSI